MRKRRSLTRKLGYSGLLHGKHMQVLISNRFGEQVSGSGIAIDEPFSYTVFENCSLRGPTEEGTFGNDERQELNEKRWSHFKTRIRKPVFVVNALLLSHWNLPK